MGTLGGNIGEIPFGKKEVIIFEGNIPVTLLIKPIIFKKFRCPNGG